ncbi:hypothetical protein ACGFNV_43710 [Streptomyces sp. NPDC048751]|uniref:hypothetical protein n=1 Tax=Streptomyces sp. NPDC048751 TaxID=3365591 RepID=UPI00370FE239
MEYVRRVPAPPLDRFIDDIYCLTGVPHHRLMNVPPMPSAHLFLHLGGPVRLWEPRPRRVVSTWSSGQASVWRPRTARFRPARWPMPLG